MNCTIRFSVSHQVEADLSSWGIDHRGMFCTSLEPLPEPAVLLGGLLAAGMPARMEYLLPTSAVIFRNGPPPPGFVSIEGEQGQPP